MQNSTQTVTRALDKTMDPKPQFQSGQSPNFICFSKMSLMNVIK